MARCAWPSLLVAAVLAAGCAGASGAAGPSGRTAAGAATDHGIPWRPVRPPAERLRPLAPACRAAALAPRFSIEGATGSLVLALTLKNTSAHACSLVGRSTVAPEGANVASVRWQAKRSAAPIAEPAAVRRRLRSLRPGEAALLSLWWRNWCGPDSQPASGPAPPPDAIVLTLPNAGGAIPVPVASAPRCDDPATPSTFLVSPFVFDEPRPAPATRLPLTARILGQTAGTPTVKPRLTTVAHRGRPFRYDVALRNVSRHVFRFRSCPT